MNPPRALHPSFNLAHWYAWQAFRASLEPDALAEAIARSEFLAWREAQGFGPEARPFADDWHTRAEVYRLMLRVSAIN